jgi:hypothetical protein
VKASRAQVLAYRLAMSGLAGGPPHDALLDLGVQDMQGGTAAQALAVRGMDAARLQTAWSFRGAPHLHRTADLPRLAAALWPLSENDAAARLAGFGTTLKKAGLSPIEAIAETAAAIRRVVTGKTSKSDLSSGVTKLIADDYSYWCRGCQATHVQDQLLRIAGPAGGIRMVPGPPAEFFPMARRPAVPKAPAGVERMVAAYLTLHGPATVTEVGGWFGSSGRSLGPAWPDGLAEVNVDGRKAWLPEESLDDLRSAAPVKGVLLLPPYDPYLQARDRDLLVADKAKAKQVWTVLGNPGVMLRDGEVAGIWRAKQAGKKRLDVTVTAFGKPPPAAAMQAEAERVAAVRGAEDVRVTVAG